MQHRLSHTALDCQYQMLHLNKAAGLEINFSTGRADKFIWFSLVSADSRLTNWRDAWHGKVSVKQLWTFFLSLDVSRYGPRRFCVKAVRIIDDLRWLLILRLNFSMLLHTAAFFIEMHRESSCAQIVGWGQWGFTSSKQCRPMSKLITWWDRSPSVWFRPGGYWLINHIVCSMLISSVIMLEK